jgi:hypothetical protein
VIQRATENKSSFSLLKKKSIISREIILLQAFHQHKVDVILKLLLPLFKEKERGEKKKV